METLSRSERATVELVRMKSNGLIAVKKTLNQTNTAYSTLMQAQISGIPQIYHVYELEKQTIVIEELVNGETLLQKGVVEEQLAIDWLLQLCHILQQVHGQNIIHRDLKPSNLMVTPRNVLYLVDFDAARMYQKEKDSDTVCLGTKGYAAPEQFGYAQTDRRSDIYALGVVGNQLTTGYFPSEKDNSGKLSPVIKRCTQLDPQLRYQTVDQVIDDLKRLQELPQKAGKPKKKINRKTIACVCVVVFLIYANFYHSPYTLRDNWITAFEHIYLILPVMMFVLDLFHLRTVPLIPYFREKRRRKWYIALYFVVWFFTLVAIVNGLNPFLSPEALPKSKSFASLMLSA